MLQSLQSSLEMWSSLVILTDGVIAEPKIQSCLESVEMLLPQQASTVFNQRFI